MQIKKTEITDREISDENKSVTCIHEEPYTNKILIRFTEMNLK